MNDRMYELGNKASVIRELFEYGKKRKKEIGEDNVFDFSIGNPSNPCPNVVTSSLLELITTKNPIVLHRYTSSAGDYEVRKKIAEYLNNKYNCNEIAEKIYLTAGAAAALTISLNAILNSGDEVIVFAPFFPEYAVFVEKAGGILKVVNGLDESFQIDFDRLEVAITKKTKAILINFPNNPTGKIITEDELKKLSTILSTKEKEYQHNIYLISDEPYRELVYDDIFIPFITNYYENSIICYSFSKSLSLPGERIGYLLVSNKAKHGELLFKAICGAGRALGFVCAPSIFQYLIPFCLGQTSDLMIYKTNRDILYKNLTEYGYEIVYPNGAFYLFMKALESSAVSFCEKAKKYELLLVPSDSFGYDGYVRISYCVETEMIERSLSAFKKLFDEYKLLRGE